MPRITIDNQEIECRDGIPVLQAALEAGWNVPHYCYHPGLTVVASCRLCLMEMKMPHPKTKEMVWGPKLTPSCQTPVRDGIEVRFNSERVRDNAKDCMEYYLLNHPLDCPICDKAGECWLQDYSYQYGRAWSRMHDQKLKNPKKDIGPHTLLYQDRCVLCSRCVRFTDEVSGTRELAMVNRGSRCEIDVFPGLPLDNPLQGNVVELCPVGCLLDKEFLFQRRVWELKNTPSTCPGCATGCSIWIDHADERIYRLRPRFNPEVNTWWICDEGRFGFHYVHDGRRIARPVVRRGQDRHLPEWENLPGIVRFRWEEHVRENGSEKIAVVLSPFLANEEAWLLVRFMREVAPDCSLVPGPIPTEGQDQRFPVGLTNGQAKFTILKEKCPNRRGVEMLLEALGGHRATFDEFLDRAGKGELTAAWITGGYPKSWVDKKLAGATDKFKLLIAQDMFETALTGAATVVLPMCGWAEREGSFVNAAGVVQPFERAIDPPDGARMDGQFLFELAGHRGLYRGERVREMMADSVPALAEVYEPPPNPLHAH